MASYSEELSLDNFITYGFIDLIDHPMREYLVCFAFDINCKSDSIEVLHVYLGAT